MRTVVVHRPGGYDRLIVEEHPDPEPAPGQVLVDAAACGVNFADCWVRMGLYASAKAYVGWPITPGFEVAGTVRAVGEGVTGFAPGDEVLAVTRFGGYASALAVPEAQVLRRPVVLPAVPAAGFPTVFLTAAYALLELARPRPGQDLLVHSAAGGVGGALVQLGRVLDCRVVGVVGASHKVEVVRQLGADAVIDTSREELWSAAERHAPDGYHVILDANGAATLRAGFEHLRPPGRLVVYGFHSMLGRRRRRGRPGWAKLLVDWLRTPRFNPLEMTGSNRSVLAFNLSYLFAETDLLGELMERLLGWVEAGRITALPVTTYPLEAVAEAHRALESGRTVGKLVLVT